MKNKIEIIANSILVVVGIIGGVFFAVKGDAGVSSVMFSIALACILYQFLGGISQDHSFQLGAIKLGGTAAVLIMFMYFLKTNILKDELAISKTSGWMAIDSLSGEITNLSIVYKGDTIYPPKGGVGKYKETRSRQAFKLIEDGSEAFVLQTSLTNEKVGYVDPKNNWPKTLFRKLEPTEGNQMVRFYLTPDLKKAGTQVDQRLPEFEWVSSSKNIRKTGVADLPFEIKLEGSYFTIVKDDGTDLGKAMATAGKCCVVPHQLKTGEACSYIVLLEQSNYRDNNPLGVNYTKWLVKMVSHVL